MTSSDGDAPHRADLELAAACLRGEQAAIATLEAMLTEARGSLRALRLDEATIDEIVQATRARLLMSGADGTPPRLGAYAGRGPLGAFVRVVATRLGLSARREREPTAGSDDGLGLVASAEVSPEVAALRAQHAQIFRASLHAALAELEPEQRSVLRLHLLDGLGVDEIGLVHRVHRATAARWIVRAKEELRRKTRKQLEARLAVRGPELESLVAALQSRLDLSLDRVLREQD